MRPEGAIETVWSTGGPLGGGGSRFVDGTSTAGAERRGKNGLGTPANPKHGLEGAGCIEPTPSMGGRRKARGYTPLPKVPAFFKVHRMWPDEKVYPLHEDKNIFGSKFRTPTCTPIVRTPWRTISMVSIDFLRTNSGFGSAGVPPLRKKFLTLFGREF